MKIWKLNNTDVSKLFLPLRRLKKVDISRLVPDRDAESTMEEMKAFLEDHHRTGQMIGFEMNYENDETTFNIVTDRYKYEQTLERFSSTHTDDGQIEVPDNQFIDVEEGDYVAVYDFDLTEDYWRPLNSYKNLQGKRDPLDKILTEMAGRNQDMSFTFQVISQPISKPRWSHRYPIQWMLKGIGKDLFNILPLAVLSVMMIGGILENMGLLFAFGLLFFPFWGYEMYKQYENELTYEVAINSIVNLVNKGIRSLANLPTWITGLTYEDYVEEMIDDKREQEKIMKKAKEDKGYVTQVRLIAVGSNEAEVEDYTKSVVDIIEDTYREEDKEISYPQAIVGKQGGRKDWALETGAEMVARDKGVDFNGRFTDKESFYWLRNKRKQPMILTPNELAGLMHFIQDTEHRSVAYE
jgi:hypothetical protein